MPGHYFGWFQALKSEIPIFIYLYGLAGEFWKDNGWVVLFAEQSAIYLSHRNVRNQGLLHNFDPPRGVEDIRF